MTDWVQLLSTAAIFLLFLFGALGLAYWANRAQSDRSALVGLYLLFGIPGGLLLIAGIASLARGNHTLGTVLTLVGVGLGLPLLRPFRELLSRVTPLDPDSAIDMSGLCVVLGFLGLFVGNSLAPMAQNPPQVEVIPSVGVGELLLQAAFLVVLSYVAAGFPYWRDLRAATERLGIIVPTLPEVGIAIGATVGCFVVAGIAGAIAQQVSPGLDESLQQVVDQITAEVQNPVGAVILGASAGIGEEAIFRGALQPRYGIIIPSLLFTMLHGPQYGFNVALLGLFGVSVILGLVRRHVNTTAAMITHALYNIVQVLALSAMS